MFDAHANLAYATVATAPAPAASGTSLTVANGLGALFPTAPFNCTVYPPNVSPLASNAEIVRVTAVVGDVFTITRAQEGTTARNIATGWQIANTATKLVFTDIENAMIQFVSAGTTKASASEVVFSNSNGVSFGVDGQTITASFSGGGGITSQSVQTQNMVSINGSTGSIVFSNSNNVTFGGNASTITASASFAQSAQPVAASASNGSFAFSTLGFSNANGVTFGTSAGSLITASIAASAANSIGFSGGTSSANLNSIIFSNSNGVSFGLNGSTMTASVPAGVAPGSLSAGTASVALGQVVFSNSNNVSFGLDGSTVTASVGSGGAAVSFSGGTSSAALGSLVFSNSNGVSFGLNGSTLTGSHNALTSQSNQAFSAEGGSSAFQTLVFTNSNGISFSNTNGSIWGSHNALTSQSNQAASASNGSFAFQTLAFSNANNVTFGTSAGSIITASVATAAAGNSVNFSGGTTSNNLATIVFSNSNGISFGLNGSTMTGSHNALTSQSNQAASASNGSFTFQTLGFSNANGVTFGTSAGSIVTASVATAAGGQGSLVSFVPYQAISTATQAVTTGQNQFASFALPQPMTLSYIRFVASMAASASNIATIASGSATANGGVVGSYSALIYQLGTGANSQSLEMITSQSVGFTFQNSISITNSTQGSYTQAITYPLNGGTSSYSTQYSISNTVYSFSTNHLTGFTGQKYIDVPLPATLSAGNYWAMFNISQNTTSAGALTAINVPRAFPQSYLVVNQPDYNAMLMGGSNNTLAQWGAGFFTTAPVTVGTVALSNLSRNGSNRIKYLQMLAFSP